MLPLGLVSFSQKGRFTKAMLDLFSAREGLQVASIRSPQLHFNHRLRVRPSRNLGV